MTQRNRPRALVASALLFCASIAPACFAADRPATQPVKPTVREEVDRAETDGELLGQRQTQAVGRTADRMADSAHRLAKQLDPGQRTQEIQARILDDIDEMIDRAKKMRDKPKGPDGCPGGPSRPGPNTDGRTAQLVAPNPADTRAAASRSETTKGDKNNPRRGDDFVERAEVFMRISPRTRPAVIDASTEQVPEKYQKLTEDYYRSIARAGK